MIKLLFEQQYLLFVVITFALIFSLTFHEYGHGIVASLIGDDTAKRAGRLTLNPLPHIDPVGTVLLPLIMLFTPAGGFLFGWAKPTPVQPRNFRDCRWGQIMTSGAGPTSNFLLAVIFTVAYAVAIRVFDYSNPLVFMLRIVSSLSVPFE